jgi:type IV pilus assembly protein PilB
MPNVSFQVLDRLGSELVSRGLISPDQLTVAQESQRMVGGDLAHILIKKGFVTEEQVLNFLSQHLNIPFLPLRDFLVDAEVIKRVPENLAKKYDFIPLFETEGTLTIAMADPVDVMVLDEIQEALGCSLQPVISSEEEIRRLIKENYEGAEVAGREGESLEVLQYGDDIVEDRADKLRELASGARIVTEVDRIIRIAAQERASDIHIEPLSKALKVRTRVDGVLEDRFTYPQQMHLPIITRIKIIGGMDIAERRIPQDGRVRVKVHDTVIDMRVSTYPTMHGEKVVIRLFSKEELRTLDSLGFSETERSDFEKIISAPHGIFLVSGPTGSGKTTTLYAALQKINSQERNIVSIEDPIENEVPGINQAQVNIKAGLTFASALRSILRQDPDVIMVGEIRDQETADIAVRSAITGHLVFSTIHTNTALGAIARLMDLGVEPFMISSALVGVMSQRLVRRVCQRCSAPFEVDESMRMALEIPPSSAVYRGKGCKHCRMSGYAGRKGIFEIVPIDRTLRNMIIKRSAEDELTGYTRSRGIVDLRGAGRALILEGTTTPEEVLRVTEERENGA